ncbi:PAS domain S-box-containing protein [Salsuginibacillus halophilus]|uniref:PAS domain S-box-containing protein n=1 Tax=Salsuginibacillus halophilus TaxID=517424 RepID=A0A2P8HBC1_9BACI|nr:PAS domain S-box protein [Salsuginibacillus halophilus]PSL43527.1 PAS domain S-box-containing protein [Salsuginibacillus halophilus]
MNYEQLLHHLSTNQNIAAASAEREFERLQALEALGLANGEGDKTLDEITNFVKKQLSSPICLITLIDVDKQWLKSTTGLPSELTKSGKIARENSVCQYAVAAEAPLIVPDLLQDSRFSDRKAILESGFRFYAGVPIFSENGYALGTLCVLDYGLREFQDDELEQLQMFAHWVESEIQLRYQLKMSHEREQTLIDLHEQNMWLYQALDTTSTAFIILDMRTETPTIVYANEAYTNLTGYELHEIDGDGRQQLHGPMTDQGTIKRIADAFHMHMTVREELLLYCKNGQIIWVDIVMNPVFNEQGELTHYTMAHHDITERKRSENTMLKQIFQQESVFEAIPDIVYHMNLDGDLLKWNGRLEEVTGFTTQEIKQKNTLDLFPERGHDLLAQQLDNVKVEGSTEFELELYTKSGSELMYRWSAMLLYEGGSEPAGIVGTATDISLDLQVEKDLSTASKLQQEMLPAPLIHRDVNIDAIYEANNYVSGDTYGYHWLDNDHLFIYLVDVMGHGVSTALQSSAIHVLFEYTTKLNIPLERKIQEINTATQAVLPENYFAAAFCAEINIRSGTMNYVSSGIPAFLTRYRDGKVGTHKCLGMLLGLFNETPVEQCKMTLTDVADIYFMTDGVYEALDTALLNERHTTESLNEYFNQLTSSGLADDATIVHVQFPLKDKKLEVN